MNIYIILWKYSDGSDVGVVRAYYQEDIAKLDLDIFNAIGDYSRSFILVEVPII